MRNPNQDYQINSSFIGIDGIKDKNVGRKIYLMDYLPRSVNYLYAGLKHTLDKFQNYKRLKKLFREKVGYDLNLDAPESFNEKTIWKKLNDRNPLLTVTADKYLVRSYIQKLLGEEEAEKILVPLYHVTSDPSDIDLDKLPSEFVIKPNHGSMMHLFITDKNKIKKEQLVKKCREWLKVNFGFYNHEWAYINIKRKILIEKLLKDDSGLPRDYRFYCFHGTCKHIRISNNRFGDNEGSIFMDTNWKISQVRNPGYKRAETAFEKPPNADEMIPLAEKLSKDFDSVRVDLYNCGGRIYFSELTHYRGGGFARFEPESFDFEMGAYWKLKPFYWLENQPPERAR